MKFLQAQLVDPLIHVAAWVSGYYGATLLLAGTSSVEAYASLSAWWFALYAGYVFGVSLRAALALFLGYFAVSAGSLLLGYEWFFREPPDDWGFMLPVVSAGQAAIFVSPVLINFGVRSIYAKATQRRVSLNR